MVNLIVWIVVGGSSGWLASLVTHTDGQQGVLVNISAGAVGASIAELVLTPLFGISTISPNHFSMPALFVPLLGAIILLSAVSIFRWGIKQQR